VPYRSRARTNDVEYERDCMFNGVMFVGFEAGQVAGFSPVPFRLSR